MSGVAFEIKCPSPPVKISFEVCLNDFQDQICAPALVPILYTVKKRCYQSIIGRHPRLCSPCFFCLTVYSCKHRVYLTEPEGFCRSTACANLLIYYSATHLPCIALLQIESLWDTSERFIYIHNPCVMHYQMLLTSWLLCLPFPRPE